MMACHSCSYLDYLDKIVDEQWEIVLLVKNLLMLIILLWLKKVRWLIKLIDSVLKTNPWTIRVKDSNGEKITGKRIVEKILKELLSKIR